MTVHLTTADYGAILPEIIVVVGAMSLLMLDVTLRRRKIEVTTGVALLTLLVAFAASVHIWVVGGGPAFPAAYPMVTGDKFAQFFNFALLASGGLAVLLAPAYIQNSRFDAGEFYALVLFALTGMMLLAASVNLMMIFLAIELLSLSLYILSGFDRARPRSQEAGFKYFLLSSFASAFLVYGMALIYGATGSTNLGRIADVVFRFGPNCGPPLKVGLPIGTDGPFLLAGIGLMAVGFAFKLSIVPFHMWTPDVYEGAPTPVTAFMSVATKAAVFAAFLRVFSVALGAAGNEWFGIVWALAIATMIVGNVLALAQSSMKRLLAYSGIAHAGYALVALSATSLNGTQVLTTRALLGARLGFTAVAFYFLVYAFMNIGAFVVVLVLENRGEAGDEISSYRGLFSRSPWLATATAVFMFSLAGFPPTAGFFAKYYAFAAAVAAGHTELAIIGVVTSVVSLGYYLRVVVLMFMQPAEEEASTVKPAWPASIVLAASVVGLFVIGIVPWFYNLASEAARSL